MADIEIARADLETIRVQREVFRFSIQSVDYEQLKTFHVWGRIINYMVSLKKTSLEPPL
jgi:hypothetical protein